MRCYAFPIRRMSPGSAGTQSKKRVATISRYSSIETIVAPPRTYVVMPGRGGLHPGQEFLRIGGHYVRVVGLSHRRGLPGSRSPPAGDRARAPSALRIEVQVS